LAGYNLEGKRKKKKASLTSIDSKNSEPFFFSSKRVLKLVSIIHRCINLCPLCDNMSLKKHQSCVDFLQSGEMDTPLLPCPTLLILFLLFLSTYFLAYFVILRNWEPKQRKEALSCFTSLAHHGSPAVIMAVRAVLLHSQTSLTFASPNSAYDNTMLELSMALVLGGPPSLHGILP
jgi:hypothetical protein